MHHEDQSRMASTSGSTSTSAPNTAAFVPPQWNSKAQQYPRGAMVIFAGCYWRCEIDHKSEEGENGLPSNNLHLWTPFAPMYAPRPPSDQPPSYAGYPQYPSWGNSSEAYSPPSRSESVFTSDSEDANWTLVNEKREDLAALRRQTEKEEREMVRDREQLSAELTAERVWCTGGIGLWAYSSDSEKENIKKSVWAGWQDRGSKDAWIKTARARTKAYNDPSLKPKPVAMWKLVERGQSLPRDAIPIGHEADGQTLFAARALYAGGLHPGKASATIGCSVSFAGQEHSPDTYEVLCGARDPMSFQWMRYKHGEKALVNGWQPVEGGREADGRSLLIAKAEHGHGLHPGKVLVGDDHACLGYGGGEVWVRPFEILAYSTSSQ